MVKRTDPELDKLKLQLMVEKSLDRVRNLAMRMKESDDLKKVVSVLFDEMGKLGFELYDSNIGILDKKTMDLTYYGSGLGGVDMLPDFVVPFQPGQIRYMDAVYADLKRRKKFNAFEFSGKALEELKDFYMTKTGFGKAPEKYIEGMLSPEYLVLSYATMKYGVLEVAGSEPLDANEITILKRFAGVLELTFTRFYDLQKAEEQVKEAKIQMALEKVRARTMAMHRSAELREVVNVFFKQLRPFGFARWGFQLRIVNEDQSGFTTWLSSPAQRVLPEQYFVPTLDHWALKKFWTIYKNQVGFDTIEVKGEDKLKFDLLCFEKSELKNLPDSVKENILSHDYVLFSCASMKHGLLEAIDVEHIQKEEIDILMRFAKVFEQTYTRFLDLQKAEAQAREAQIEAALERVRARAMAMHKTDELRAAGRVLYQELAKLGIVSLTSAYSLMDEGEKIVWYYYADPADGSIMPEPMGTPCSETQPMRSLTASWKKQEPYHIVELDSQETIDHQTFIAERSLNFPYTAAELISFSPEELKLHTFNFKQGYLLLVGGEKLSADQIDIMIRFTRVFGMTYKRFLDLQKAEEHAREAEIQLALERVRARTMAMHRSDELREVVAVLYEQMIPLGLAALGCELILCDEENEQLQYWSAVPEQARLPECYPVPKIIHPFFQQVWKAWKKETPRLVVTLKGQEKRKFDKLIFEKTAFKNFPESAKNAIRAGKVDVFSLVTMKYGLLEAADVIPLPESKFQILERFAKVFEQTYTRFLDLQKAETQAREAQVEAALERIRSRTMAMQNTDELLETAGLLYKELFNLSISSLTSGYVLMDEEEKIGWNYDSSPADGSIMPEPLGIPHTETEVMRTITASWKKQEPFHIMELDPQETVEHQTFIAEHTPNFPFTAAELIAFSPERLVLHTFNFKEGYLLMINGEKLATDQIEMMIRFTRAFEQTYTRFLDLKKAEEQTREAEIQLALERIRARTMAMHKSEELDSVASVLFHQLQELNMPALRRCLIGIVDEANATLQSWYTSMQGESSHRIITYPLDGHPVVEAKIKGWRRGKPFNIALSGRELEDLLKYSVSHGFEYHKGEVAATHMIQNHAPFAYGYLEVATHEPISDQDFELLQRFARVFEQTYTRFLDLQNAEAQAREAQIEASLERVRSRSMAMHKSDELKEVIACIFEQLQDLEFVVPACSLIFYQEDLSAQHWFAGYSHEVYPESYTIPYIDIPYYTDMLESWQKGQEYGEYIMKGKAKVDYAEWLLNESDFKNLPKEFVVQSGMLTPDPMYFADAFNKYGMVEVIGNESIPEDKADILKRVSKVIEQTYTRFLDLQKAEARAREARIESALERVRTRSMAMQKSVELKDLVHKLSNEIGKLDVIFNRTFICIFDPTTLGSTWWMSNPESGESFGLFIKYHEHYPYQEHIKAWRERKAAWQYILKGHDKKEWDAFLFTETDLSLLPETIKHSMQSKTQVYLSCSFNNFGYLVLESSVPLSGAQFDILSRFAKTFDQSYTRFLDIQKAEAQAREAQIEAALERVRARTMALQNSNELLDAAALMFQQLNELGGNLFATGFVLLDKEKIEGEFWMSAEGKFQPPIYIPNTVDPATKNMYHHWKKGEELYYEDAGGDALRSHYEYLMSLPETGNVFKGMLEAGINFPEWQRWHAAYFSQGYLLIITREPFEDVDLFKRFARTFDQTYTRFLDLKQVEAREKEAIQQSSLDRVRAEIASMRTSDDLNRITPLIWRELTTLGVPFFRCGVFIVDDVNEKISVYLSTPSGESLAAWHSEYDSLPLFRATVDHWKKQKVYREEWDKKQFIKFTKSLIDQGLIDSPTRYQAGKDAPEYLALQMIPFEQGMLYVGSAEKLDDEKLAMAKSLAEAFSVAYARYEDFRKLEEAKSHIENTLTELKAAQTQLIHAEKMASLGELTAGIAHEIQNPLNFVNNFSEVSVDLIEDMEEGMINGNMEEVKAITEDIRQNLEKINHHGKRASDIVKGMLQHSRSNSGQKEAIDINLLAEEYLRLAYHGLRAKDKSFNADFKTDLDESIPKVNVIGQEIGRVLLNLINNAFYAVSDKQIKEGKDYKPIVKLTTKRMSPTGDGQGEENIRISIKDNGPGIPEIIRDKIFQPFFTTKPSGQGTGLGLSLSYDIITKGHHGSLEVVTEEGSGTEFIIILPIN